MRYDKAIFFQHVTDAYNADTGNYDAESIKEDKKYASVTDSGVETMRIVYGGVKQGSLTLRLLAPYTKPFDRIRVGDKAYNVDFSRTLRQKQVFVVSEVQ